MRPATKFAGPALAALALLAFAPQPGLAQEERCTELGASCICSEPFNAGSFESYQCDRRSCMNPSDTNQKECSGEFRHGYSWYGGDALEVVATPGTAENLPAGNSVDYVWRSHDEGNNVHHVMHAGGVTNSTRRICTRHYFKTSSDYNDGEGSCSNRKHIDFAKGGGARVFFVRDQGPGYRLEMPGYRTAPDNVWGAGDLMNADCRTGWCRVELCIDGDVQNLRDLSVDGYIQQVGGPKRSEFPRKFIGNAPGGDGYQDSWLLNMYREGSGCRGWRQFSHVMFAGWNSASGQYIGPACEMEGVCDGSSGGSGGSGGTPQPPPADQLSPPGRPYLVQ